ncbi:MAG: SDR family NAD(P)-dependent oxidoreductase [Actinomyces sp.]|nr:MAG: SDR family NAD(P)-dependent oxidoreductase [Actinomyces sp.]
MPLDGARVVVTGASRGIGAAVAEHFARAGARVLGVARTREALEEVSRRTGGEHLVADLTDPDEVDTLVERCLERLGHIDVWVNNAGIETDDAFVRVERAGLRRLARLDFEVPVLLTRDVVPHMLERGRGRVVQMSSIAGVVPYPGLTAYAGAKAGLRNFTESLRLELKGSGVGLTVVSPGPVATAMWDRVDAPDAWAGPALRRFRRLAYLPVVPVDTVARKTVRAVRRGQPRVRVPRRYLPFHLLAEAPGAIVRATLTGVRLPRVEPLSDA